MRSGKDYLSNKEPIGRNLNIDKPPRAIRPIDQRGEFRKFIPVLFKLNSLNLSGAKAKEESPLAKKNNSSFHKVGLKTPEDIFENKENIDMGNQMVGALSNSKDQGLSIDKEEKLNSNSKEGPSFRIRNRSYSNSNKADNSYYEDRKKLMIESPQNEKFTEKPSGGVVNSASKNILRPLKPSAMLNRIQSANACYGNKKDLNLIAPRPKVASGIRNKAAELSRDLPNVIQAVPPPKVTAKCWALINGRSKNIIWGYKYTKTREVASLTKIMTLYVSLQIARRLNIDENKMVFIVSWLATTAGGTTANLNENDEIYLRDLYYGLMLPSGNDAAWCLAECFGVLLHHEMQGNMECIKSFKELGRVNPVEEFKSVKNPVKFFLDEMNKTAKDLGLMNTTYFNPHGLINKFNKSTALDVAILSSVALLNPVFRNIVSTKDYSCIVLNKDREQSPVEKNWRNTNKLLDDGFEGVKTGITDNAGPCLSASFRKKGYLREHHLIVVVLASRSMEDRWSECSSLVDWAMKNMRDLI